MLGFVSNLPVALHGEQLRAETQRNEQSERWRGPADCCACSELLGCQST